MIEIRNLGEDDWQSWRAVRLTALTDAPEQFGSTVAEWSGDLDSEQRWRHRLRSAPLNLVLYDDDVPVGMASTLAPDSTGAEPGDGDPIGQRPPPAVEIISVWVAPQSRGTGVGDTAIRAALDWARQTYPEYPVELSVRIGNVHATALYERHGFSDAGPSPWDVCERLLRRG